MASPARQALKSNLDADDDSPLTLSKKKSWFGSLRNVMSKGALQAKAAVDGFRADEQKTGQKLEPEPRQSIESVSSCGSARSGHGRHPTTRTAATSLRRALPGHALTFPSTRDDCLAHRRRPSVASSLIGSIRRKAGRETPPAVSQLQETSLERPESHLAPSPERPAENIPLPSSPINIPAAAPSLELDLGPAYIMPDTFGRSPDKRLSLDTLRLTDPANTTAGLPESSPAPIADEAGAAFQRSGDKKPLAPRELLRISPATDLGPTPPSAPPTPMPGTNFSLDVDGANSEKGSVFERSVTPSDQKERKELRTMRSLSAMAEACAVAHRSDDVETVKLSQRTEDITEATPINSSEGSTSVPKPARASSGSGGPLRLEQSSATFGDALSPKAALPTPRRDGTSASTIHTIPPDMPELTRQRAAEPEMLDSGPPSPERTIRLPLRPKVTIETSLDGRAATAGSIPRAETSASTDEEFADEGLSPHGGPLAPQLYDGISNEQTPSPSSVRSRTTYITGLESSQFKFTVNSWLKSTSSVQEPDDAPGTPNRRSMDMSLDSVSSTEERLTPQISPTSTNPGRTPSMGNRVEFELKRSDRNMRYNALHQDRTHEHPGRLCPSVRQPLRFIVGSSEESDQSGLRLPDFANAEIETHRTGAADSTSFSPGEPGSAELRWYDRILKELSPSREHEPLSSPVNPWTPLKPARATGRDKACVKRPTVFGSTPSPLLPSSTPTITGMLLSNTSDPYRKGRDYSSDTLDDTLPLFSSPDSGYQADKSSASPEEGAINATPKL